MFGSSTDAVSVVGTYVRSVEQAVESVFGTLDGRFKMHPRTGTRLLAALIVALAVVACSGGATPTPRSGAGSPAAGGSVAGSSAEPSAEGGGNGYEGKLVSTGIYGATWTSIENAEANPFNSVSNLTVSSDKGTFGNIKVNPDGTVSFGSAATELVQNSSYDGTGAQVTLDKSSQFVCAFTIDTDLKGNHDGGILHMSGGMTVHWHPLGIGDLSCP